VTRRTGNISVIQFDERSISFLRIRRTAKGIEVLASEQVRGEWSAEDGTLADALKRLTAAHRIAQDDVYSVLPRHEMTARILTLPSQDATEIDGMVRLSAEEFVPYPADELVIGQCVLQRLADGHSRTLAVFAHRDVVDAHVRLLHGAGMEPRRIFVSSACLASAAIAARGDAQERYGLVNLASGGLEMLVVNGHRLEYDRAIAMSHDWDALGSDAAEELALEVRATLSAHRRESEDGLRVERLYLSSDWTDVGTACARLAEDTGYECRPASFVDAIAKGKPLSRLPLVLVGAAFAAQDRAAVAVDLVPESLVQARQRSVLKRKLATGGLLGVSVVAAMLVWYGVAVHQRNAYLRDLGRRIDEVRPVAQAVATKERNLRVLREHVERSGTALDLLVRAMELAPESGLRFTRFTFERGREAKIEGRVLDRSLITRYTDELRNAGDSEVPQFREARTGGSNPVTERNEPVHEFEIDIPFPEPESQDEESSP